MSQLSPRVVVPQFPVKVCNETLPLGWQQSDSTPSIIITPTPTDMVRSPATQSEWSAPTVEEPGVDTIVSLTTAQSERLAPAASEISSEVWINNTVRNGGSLSTAFGLP